MKSINYLVLTCLAALLTAMIATACSTQQHLVKTGDGKIIDLQLVGNWEGSEEDNQVKGMTKQWTMVRTEDGRFVLDFRATMEGETQQFIEAGNWWVKDGKFYEYHENSGKTDTYEYTLLNEDQVKFKAIALGVAHENEAYEFIDTRIKGPDHR
jgi:hypothetical protein